MSFVRDLRAAFYPLPAHRYRLYRVERGLRSGRREGRRTFCAGVAIFPLPSLSSSVGLTLPGPFFRLKDSVFLQD